MVGQVVSEIGNPPAALSLYYCATARDPRPMGASNIATDVAGVVRSNFDFPVVGRTDPRSMRHLELDFGRLIKW